jgi:hypothetical protein
MKKGKVVLESREKIFWEKKKEFFLFLFLILRK